MSVVTLAIKGLNSLLSRMIDIRNIVLSAQIRGPLKIFEFLKFRFEIEIVGGWVNLKIRKSKFFLASFFKCGDKSAPFVTVKNPEVNFGKAFSTMGYMYRKQV